jgi:hypothetical protein
MFIARFNPFTSCVYSPLLTRFFTLCPHYASTLLCPLNHPLLTRFPHIGSSSAQFGSLADLSARLCRVLLQQPRVLAAP